MKPSDQARWQGSVDSWLAQGWASEGLIVAPGVNALLADTGQLVQGCYDFVIILSCNVVRDPNLLLQHRNAANDGNIGSHALVSLAYFNTVIDITNYKMATNQRMRLINLVGFPQSVCGSIIYKLRI